MDAAITILSECSVCMEPTPNTIECSACSMLICQPCYQTYLICNITAGNVLPHQLICPGEDCQFSISAATLECYLSPEMINKYKQFVANHEHLRQGGRYCPRAECGAPIPAEIKKTCFKRRIDCPTCSQRSCINCGEPYHFFPKRGCTDKQFKRWCKQTKSQRCPNCLYMIEKNGGCSHMTCSQCRHEFTYGPKVRLWTCRNMLDKIIEFLIGVVVIPLVVIHLIIALILGVPYACIGKVYYFCARKKEKKKFTTFYNEGIVLIMPLLDDE